MLLEKNVEISAALEDYLEAIFNLNKTRNSARVKDIAEAMGVTMPSVNGAIRALAAKGLVIHKPYESVELTSEGAALATSVVNRHSAVKEFLINILGLDFHEAEREACQIEHSINPATLERLLAFADFVRDCETNTSLRISDFKHFQENGQFAATCVSAVDFPLEQKVMLSHLCPGTKGRIVKIHGRGPIRKRMIEMGLTKDTTFEVIRIAPLGDPIEIVVRGYHLSMRKSEADQVEVELAK